MSNEASIKLNSYKIIGVVSVDGSKVRGEGGFFNPQLIVPLNIQLSHQPENAAIAVARLIAVLGTDQNMTPDRAICPPSFNELMGGSTGFRARSLPNSQATTEISLRFFLTREQVEEFERRRHHATPSTPFTLYVQLEPLVVGLRTFGTADIGQASASSAWGTNYGIHSEANVFWTAEIDTLRIDIETSSWVRNVLPGLGYDRVRLIELQLPPALPHRPNAGAEFDKAISALDARHYEDCVGACRGLIALWKNDFGATEKKPLADILAEQLGWIDGDKRKPLLDAVLKASTDFVNIPHHPEGAPEGIWSDHRDAKFMLMLTSILSEYLGSISFR